MVSMTEVKTRTSNEPGTQALADAAASLWETQRCSRRLGSKMTGLPCSSVIREANRAARELLNIKPETLDGASLIIESPEKGCPVNSDLTQRRRDAEEARRPLPRLRVSA